MATDFATALMLDDIEAVRRCPKADLHTHGWAGADRAYVAERTGRDITPLTVPLATLAEMDAWTAANVSDLFRTPQGRMIGLEGVFVRALKDGLSHIDFGDDVWMITQGHGSAADLHASAAEAHARIAPGVAWTAQLGLSRHCQLSWLQRWIAPFLELDVYRSLDLSGDELIQPIEVFQPLYRAAKARGLRLKAHVGEWGVADDVWRAVETLELDEVQHGIAAADSPAVMRFLADSGVRLNICPTSNLMLGRVARIEDHPIRALFDAGVKVTVNSDDSLVFGAGVSEEFLTLHRAGLFTAAELDLIRQWGLA